MTYSNDKIRFKIDLNKKDALLDLLDQTAPTVWKGADWLFQFGLTYGEDWIDVSNFTSVTLEVQSALNGTVLITETTSTIDTACTEEDFDAGTDQQFEIEVDRTKTGLDLNDAEYAYFHLVVYATVAGGEQIPLGSTSQLTVKDSGMSVAPSPPAGDPTYYTAEEVDAKFANLGILSGGKFYKLVVEPLGGDVSKPVLNIAAGVDP